MATRNIAHLIPFLIFLSLAHAACASGVHVNEVYPQSPEWLEFRNPGNEALNLSDWFVSDGSSNDTITCHTIANCTLVTEDEYFIVIDRKSRIEEITNDSIRYFYVDDNSIGNGLNNDQDAVSVFSRDRTSSMNYTSSSPRISWSLCSGAWIRTAPTPGRENHCMDDLSLRNVIIRPNITPTVVAGSALSDLFVVDIRNKTGCDSAENISLDTTILDIDGDIVHNESRILEVGCHAASGPVSWTANASGSFTVCGIVHSASGNDADVSDDRACTNLTVIGRGGPPCDIAASLDLESQIVHAGNATHFWISLNDTMCTPEKHDVNFTYWIQDLFGRTLSGYPKRSSTVMGCFVRLPAKQWTPEDSPGSDAYLISVNATPQDCTDEDPDDDVAERLIVVRGSAPYSSDQSYVRITGTDANDGSRARFGDDVIVDLEAYRNDTGRYAIYIWAEGLDGQIVSRKSVLHASEKNRMYSVSLPVSLSPDCGRARPDGDYMIIAEGLGARDSMIFPLSGNSPSSCGTVATRENPLPSKQYQFTLPGKTVKAVALEIAYHPGNISAGDTFETIARIENRLSTSINASVYSYAFNGSLCMSLGYDGLAWRRSFDANEQRVSIPQNGIRYVRLASRIDDLTRPGIYRLRVRLRHGNETEDVTENLSVAGPAVMPVQTVPPNPSNPVARIPDKAPSTGMAVTGDDDIFSLFSDALGSLQSWLASLFKF